MHIDPRPGGASAIRKIVMHLNAGPEQEGGAASLVRYLQSIDGGYHEVVDNKTVIICARPDQRVYGAAGMNDRGYHICLIGNLQSAEEWADAYSRGELDIAAKRVAQRCHDFGIPAYHMTDAQVAGTEDRGICDHWAVNRAIQHGDHVDVGPGFPWTNFMNAVVDYYDGTGPAPPARKMEEPMLIEAPAGDPDQFQGMVIDPGAEKITVTGDCKVDPPLNSFKIKAGWLGCMAPGPNQPKLQANQAVVVGGDKKKYKLTVTKV